MIKTAIIGFGGAAKNFHIPLVQNSPDLQLAAVCTSQADSVRQYLGDIPCFSDYNALLQLPDIQLVVIATPNKFHYQMALDAINCGKHLVIEKPVSINAEEVQHLAEMADAKGVKVIPFHNRRWDGDFLTVKKLLEQKELGDIKLFESHFDRFRPNVSDAWKEQPNQNSGVWYDIGPHLLDQVFELFGTPSAITSHLLCQREGSDTVDYFNVKLHYQDYHVIIGASYHCAGPVRRFQIQGSQGTFIKDGIDPQAAQLVTGLSPTAPEYGLDQASPYGHLYKPDSFSNIATEAGKYQDFYQAVANCILQELPPPVSLDAALKVAKFLQLGVLSQEQNKTIWVRQFRD